MRTLHSERPPLTVVEALKRIAAEAVARDPSLAPENDLDLVCVSSVFDPGDKLHHDRAKVLS
jgi:hypothetical protein